MRIAESFLCLVFFIDFLCSFLNEGTPCITDCVMAELEKLGQKYRVALRYVFLVLFFLIP